MMVEDHSTVPDATGFGQDIFTIFHHINLQQSAIARGRKSAMKNIKKDSPSIKKSIIFLKRCLFLRFKRDVTGESGCPK